LALLNAEIRPGIELILDLIDFDRRVLGADLVVTGEGSLDEQSLAGKAPVGVARAAARSGVPVVAVAGRLQLSPLRLREAGIAAAYALAELEPDLDRCIANASPLLRRVGTQIATDWLASIPKVVSNHTFRGRTLVVLDHFCGEGEPSCRCRKAG
jgi:glycerate kinase